MPNPLITIENLNFSYENEGSDPAPALSGINLVIEEGSFTAVIGHNGSGKSTLAKLLNVILTPTSGRITVMGMDAADPANTIPIRRNVGMVFQNPDNQIVAAIVEEDVAFGPENLGVPPPEIRQRVDKALALVGMTEHAMHSPHQLSGGQKQRVAIAGIIAMNPRLIILDESTAMLDPVGRAEVMATIRDLRRERGLTVVMITHFMDEAVLADRVLVLNKGELFMDGTPREVFSKHDMLEKAGVDVPQITELMRALSRSEDPAMKRYAFPPDILTVGEAADLIEAYVK